MESSGAEPKFYFQELVSYADQLELGRLDDIPQWSAQPEVRKSDPEWRYWTQYDRLGPLPSAVAPDRLYLNSQLQTPSAVGDFSGHDEDAIKIASRRFVTTLVERGQPNLQVFPLTFRMDGPSAATPPEIDDQSLVAIYCDEKMDIVDWEASDISRLNPWCYTRLTSNPYDDGNPDPEIYCGTWLRLPLRNSIDPRRVTLPPVFGLKGLRRRLFVSPSFACFLTASDWQVSIVKRPLDFEAFYSGPQCPVGY